MATDSSTADWMNPHVLIIPISAFSSSGVTGYPSARSSPSMTSLSTRFLAQPKVTRHTLDFTGAFSIVDPLLGIFFYFPGKALDQGKGEVPQKRDLDGIG